MSQQFLQLNEDKTEIILFVNKEKRISVSKHLDSLALKTKDQVQNLGILRDSDLTSASCIKAITQTASYHLKPIAKIKGFGVPKRPRAAHSALISTRVDDCNGLLTGLPKRTIKQLQLIQNAAARVVSRSESTEHITPGPRAQSTLL